MMLTPNTKKGDHTLRMYKQQAWVGDLYTLQKTHTQKNFTLSYI